MDVIKVKKPPGEDPNKDGSFTVIMTPKQILQLLDDEDPVLLVTEEESA
ncbi:MAG: hypothetical protein Q7S70_02660 [bacterium]|nr:hypothetical protein [bacterium]